MKKLKLFKKLFCEHNQELEFIENTNNFSIWECCNCGEIIYKKRLWDNDNLRFK